MPDELRIESLAADDIDGNAYQLADVLNACVHDGASVGFVLPYELTDSLSFWTDLVRPSVAAGTRVLLVARLAERIAGTVQLDFDTLPNQTHRADVLKLLVHPDFRRRGIGRTLMVALEQRALELGRRLLTLDTAGAAAAALYRSLGFETAGEIPGYARDPHADRLDPTIIMYKAL